MIKQPSDERKQMFEDEAAKVMTLRIWIAIGKLT
jgi:hypothetical protein